MTVTLYSYFRSSCSWRVRIALNLFNVPHTIRPVNLLKNEQSSDWYLVINPLGTVPAFSVPDIPSPVFQSLAIIDLIDKDKCLLPKDPADRSRALQIALSIASDLQPLQNLSVVNRVATLVGGGTRGEEEKMNWILHHNRTKLAAIEKLVRDHSIYSINDEVSLADVCIIPQLYSASRFGINIQQEFPKLWHVAKRLERLEAFERAHAHSQIDCPTSLRGSIYFK
jgi:maleylacetoacetate isomerase